MEATTDTPGLTVDATRLVAAVNDYNRALHSSITMRLYVGSHVMNDSESQRMKDVLGEAGPKLVDGFRNAREALTRALLERCSSTRHAMHEQLQILLAAGAVAVEDDWYTLTDIDTRIGQVRAKVDRIDSARIQADGSVWGFLHVSPQEHCGESWSFTWHEGKLTVRSRD